MIEARQAGSYRREYLGLVAAPPDPASGEWLGPIAIDPADPRRRVVDPRRGRRAATVYETVAQREQATVLRLYPKTGRTHQLRVHAAAADRALLGDRHYGGVGRLTLPNGRVLTARRVMLHCARVSVPLRGDAPQEFRAEVPSDLSELWLAVGGSSEVFELISS
jgi:23S rRNA-/tRNA-specific pseudouridylate synthase